MRTATRLGKKGLLALTLSTMLGLSVSLLASAPAVASTPAGESGGRGTQLVLVDQSGIETPVTIERFLEIQAAGGFEPGTGGGMSPMMHSQWEGDWYRSLKLYFNKDETNRIAAGGAACTWVLSKIPSSISAVVGVGCGVAMVWATSAIVSGSCVGFAKSPIPLTPYPIYHRGQWCY